MSMKLDISAPEECERISLNVTQSFANRLRDYHQCALEMIGDGVKMSDVVSSAMDKHMKGDRTFQAWLKERDAKRAEQNSGSDETSDTENDAAHSHGKGNMSDVAPSSDSNV